MSTTNKQHATAPNALMCSWTSLTADTVEKNEVSVFIVKPSFCPVLRLSGRNTGRWQQRYWCEKNGLSQCNHVSFYSCHRHHPAFPQWPLQAWWWSGLQAESFTRCCSDYCNICNVNSGAGHQRSRHNSHDNEVTVSAQDKMTMMFLSQCVDYALYS